VRAITVLHSANDATLRDHFWYGEAVPALSAPGRSLADAGQAMGYTGPNPPYAVDVDAVDVTGSVGSHKPNAWVGSPQISLRIAAAYSRYASSLNQPQAHALATVVSAGTLSAAEVAGGLALERALSIASTSDVSAVSDQAFADFDDCADDEYRDEQLLHRVGVTLRPEPEPEPELSKSSSQRELLQSLHAERQARAVAAAAVREGLDGVAPSVIASTQGSGSVRQWAAAEACGCSHSPHSSCR
jgi:hypothetical protein